MKYKVRPGQVHGSRCRRRFIQAVNDNEPKARQRYVVSLTEKYETYVWAASRKEAIDKVDQHGGSSPVLIKVSARLAADQAGEPDGEISNDRTK